MQHEHGLGASSWAKLWRFTRIYGPGRTFFKVAGRLRTGVPAWWLLGRRREIGIIGCGQFAFATIGYFLHSAFGRSIVACFDTDARARDSFARALHVPHPCETVDDLLSTPGLRVVYVTSNHASHAPYAVQALARGLVVYVEKPVAVTRSQLIDLMKARRAAPGRLCAGYNRPFSAAIKDLRRMMPIDSNGGISMQCFIAGHRIGPDHWYRHPGEGTRVCGNIGHWLDLMVHVLGWRGLPDRLEISVMWASPSERDDNVSISISTDRGDVFAVMLSSRSEPFEGIGEAIHVQHGETTCRIDDFRRMTLWQGSRVAHRRYWPKDVGHRQAIGQPFDEKAKRDWREVEFSSLLMLHIADMVRDGRRQSNFSFKESWLRLREEVESA